MKFIITTIGTAGDVYPFVGIAQELKKRGHSVHFLTSEVYQSEIEKHSIHFHSVLSKEAHQKAIANPKLNRLLTTVSTFSRNFIIPTLAPTLNFIQQHQESDNTILVSHVMFFGARIAQDKLGIPLVTIQPAPMGLLSINNPLRYPGITFPHTLPHGVKTGLFNTFMWLLDRMLLLPEINAFRASLDLNPIKWAFKGWVHSPSQIIGLFPKWFGSQPKDWPKQLAVTGFPLYNPTEVNEIPKDLRHFLKQPRPTVVFTAGSGMTYAHHFFDESIMACKQLGCNGLLLTPHHQQIPTSLPDHIYHLDYLPLNILLPHTAAIVHFGGIGTAAQALAHGIPQLVVPNIGDQFDNALRLRQCGVALELKQSQYKRKHIVNALNELLTCENIRLNCQKYATLIKKEGEISEVCDILERATESGANR